MLCWSIYIFTVLHGVQVPHCSRRRRRGRRLLIQGWGGGLRSTRAATTSASARWFDLHAAVKWIATLMETGKLKSFPFNLTSRAEKRLSFWGPRLVHLFIYFYLRNGESNETFTGDDRTPAGSENVQNYSVCAIIFHLLQCKYKNISLKEQSHKLVNTIFCLTNSSWALHEQATVKRFHDFFSNFHEDMKLMSAKSMCGLGNLALCNLPFSYF